MAIDEIHFGHVAGDGELVGTRVRDEHGQASARSRDVTVVVLERLVFASGRQFELWSVLAGNVCRQSTDSYDYNRAKTKLG